MRALDDAGAGDWIRAAVEPEMTASLRWFVPAGYPAVLRIFPPFELDRPIGIDWSSLEAAIDRDPHAVTVPPIETASATWAETAERFGRRMHPLAQSHRLLGIDYDSDATCLDAQGWRYDTHFEGRMPPATLAALARLLKDHTSTPDDVVAAFWGGWSDGPSDAGTPRHFATYSPESEPGPGPDPVPDGRADPGKDAGSGPDPDSRRAPAAGSDAHHAGFRPGLTPWSRNRRPPANELQLPYRDHLMFASSLAEIADVTWPARTPWASPFDGDSPVTPSILWPADRAWVLVQEVDFDTVVLACSPATAGAVLASGEVEAARIDYDADLGPWGDEPTMS